MIALEAPCCSLLFLTQPLCHATIASSSIKVTHAKIQARHGSALLRLPHPHCTPTLPKPGAYTEPAPGKQRRLVARGSRPCVWKARYKEFPQPSDVQGTTPSCSSRPAVTSHCKCLKGDTFLPAKAFPTSRPSCKKCTFLSSR